MTDDGQCAHVHSTDLLFQYESSEDNETCGGKDSPAAEKVLKENQPRTVYLITYSQADIRVIPTRQAFEDKVLNLEALRATDAFEVSVDVRTGKALIWPNGGKV